MFCKVPLNARATISIMLLFSFFYAQAIFGLEGGLENVFYLEYFLLCRMEG